MRDDFLVFGSPKIEEDEINEVVQTLRSGWLGTGPKVTQFENLFKDYVGSQHAMALNSCTAGLHLAMLTSGVGPGDEVITTPLTFAATANSILHTGATPVFVDVERDTMNIDASRIEEKITNKTKVILPVHLTGRPCDMDPIHAVAKKHNLLVIEDAAHAIETTYKGKKVGSMSHMTCFSFYVTKNITTSEGGMVTTNNEELAGKVQMYGLHGLSKGAWSRYSDAGFKHYNVIYPGFKYNMTDIQASLGMHQVKRIDQYWKRREEIWNRYNEAFAGLPFTTPSPVKFENSKHAYHLYTLLIDGLTIDRDTFQAKLHEMKIGTGIHYIALHLHPYYENRFSFKPDDFPNARYISDRTISLPLSAKLTDKDVNDVIEAVTTVAKTYAR